MQLFLSMITIIVTMNSSYAADYERVNHSLEKLDAGFRVTEKTPDFALQGVAAILRYDITTNVLPMGLYARNEFSVKAINVLASLMSAESPDAFLVAARVETQEQLDVFFEIARYGYLNAEMYNLIFAAIVYEKKERFQMIISSSLAYSASRAIELLRMSDSEYSEVLSRSYSGRKGVDGRRGRQ